MNQKLPSLDGWRAVSILFVLLGHSSSTPGFPAIICPFLDLLRISSVGVRFFFVISGFLITWLLLRENVENKSISLKHFYIRRVLRIVPVYCCYLMVLRCSPVFSQTMPAWIGNLTFTTNFTGASYPTAHLWSLAVEEQFYLIWPGILFLVLGRANSAAALLKILLIPITVAPVARLIDSKNYFPPAFHFLVQGGSFFAKWDSLAFGCAAAILFFYYRQRVESICRDRPGLVTWGGMALLLLPPALHLLGFPGRLQAALFESMQALGFAALLVQSILYSKNGFYRVLNWHWVRHCGVLSYSIYIWQQMFFNTGESVFGVKGAWWLRFPTWIILALLAAHVSYYFLEKPLFSLRAKFRD